MNRPPRDPRRHRIDSEPTQRGVLASYAIVAAVLLVALGHGSAARAVTVVALAGLAVVARGVLRLLRCFVECGGFALDLGGTVRIRVTRPESRG